MSSSLTKAYYEDDFDSFQRLLEASAYNTRPHAARGGPVIGSPARFGSSPITTGKGRKSAGGGGTPLSGGNAAALSKGEINARDATGQTLLHRAASSTSEDAVDFASALVAHPLIDLYIQDYENGWTALHRAFYFGNVTIARLILERDAGDALGRTTGHVQPTLGLIKVKDKEGLGPLDLYAATIKDRTLRPDTAARAHSHLDGDEEGPADDVEAKVQISYTNIDCDQLFTFGSNKNLSLGFGDEDDRQYPERVSLRRPEHLLRRFYTEHLDQHNQRWAAYGQSRQPKRVDVSAMWTEDIPMMPKSKPLIIQDVHMSKLHSAVITSDPESNLYLCGHGQGGRLGAGDEQTRFHFVCIEGGALAGKRVAHVALGLNHTLALSDEGEIFSWGNNGFGQLGYNLPKTTFNDEDPISTIPRQIFGPLKRETVVGLAASRVHSVAHTGDSLFTFGKNEGQLGIVDSDARSLDIQVTPRKVAAALFTSTITSVSATEKATVCLLTNHDIWVFANYGYAKIQIPLEGFTNYFLRDSFRVTTYDQKPNRIVKLTGGGDTICALSSRGEIFTLAIGQRVDNQASASTTNPSKIRSAITPPQRIWSPKRKNMAARDVGVDVDGSIILSTEEGSVWRRTKRATLKDATAFAVGDYKPKDYKFSRVPGLTRVLAVRASSHGAYAAVRRDCDVAKTQIVVEEQGLRRDLLKLLSLCQPSGLHAVDDDESDADRNRFWQGKRKPDQLQSLKGAIIESKDVEADLANLEERSLADDSAKYDTLIGTTTSKIRIPIHRFVLTARSRVFRRGFRDLCKTSTLTLSELAVSEIDDNGRTIVQFQGIDILTIVDLVIYLYTDSFIDFWHLTRTAPRLAHRYRQVRIELMKIATKLELNKLEPAARQMVLPRPCLDMDLDVAFHDPAFLFDGDVVVQLEDDEVRAHSALLRARCPFFEGLFMGRAGGRWLAGRESQEDVNVDLQHINLKTFTIVLRHIYADTGAEAFDDIVSVGIDDFLDTVLEVMSVANELMLDRLSQICQEVIGRFVNNRNVCGLLNAIAPSSVHEFKDAALEYICLSLEAMLQGHHLNELDEDLQIELDSVVRQNQLACMPFAKSGRAERLLLERHPELAVTLDRARQAKIDAATLRAKFQNIDAFVPGSLDDELSASPVQQKVRRKSAGLLKPDAGRPLLKGKASSKDMMFAMDEEREGDSESPGPSPSIRPMSSKTTAPPPLTGHATKSRDERQESILLSPALAAQDVSSSPATKGLPVSPGLSPRMPSGAGQPWNLSPLLGTKSDMKDIMAQASSGRTSSLSQSLAAARQGTGPAAATPTSLLPTKMSQKERKRHQQAQQSLVAVTVPEETILPTTPSSDRPAAAWRTVSSPKPSSIANALQEEKLAKFARVPNTRSPSTPQLTMRQTVAHTKPTTPAEKPIIGPSGQSPLQQRSISDSKATKAKVPEPSNAQLPRPVSHSKPIPQSIRHQPPPDLSILGLSMSEIVAQQQLEKDVVKEAVAPRDLQDIQAEQEFEEWWSKESARIREAEKTSAASKKRHRHRGGRGGKSSGRGKVEGAGSTAMGPE